MVSVSVLLLLLVVLVVLVVVLLQLRGPLQLLHGDGCHSTGRWAGQTMPPPGRSSVRCGHSSSTVAAARDSSIQVRKCHSESASSLQQLLQQPAPSGTTPTQKFSLSRDSVGAVYNKRTGGGGHLQFLRSLAPAAAGRTATCERYDT